MNARGGIRESESQPGGLRPHADESPGFFRHHLVHVRALPTPTKVVAALGVALVAIDVGGIALARPPQGGAQVSFVIAPPGLADSQVASVTGSLLALSWVSIAGLIILSLLAALHARSAPPLLIAPVALLALTLFVLMVNVRSIVLAIPVAAIGVLFHRTWRRDFPPASHEPEAPRESPMRFGSVALVASIVSGYLVAAYWALGESQMGFALFRIDSYVGVWVLIPALILVGSDFGEMADAMTGPVARFVAQADGAVPTRGHALIGITAVGAGVLIALAIDAIGFMAVLVLLPAGVITVYATVIICRQKLAGLPSRPPPAAIVVTVTLLLFVISLGTYVMRPHNDVVAITTYWACPLFAFLFPLSLSGLRRDGVWDDAPTRIAASYVLVIVCWAWFVGFSASLLIMAGHHYALTQLVLCAAGVIGTGVLCGLGWITRLSPPPFDGGRAVLALFRVVFGTLLLVAVDQLFLVASGAGDRLGRLQAVVVGVALAWDLAVSGAITNKDGSTFGRQSRVMLMVGYALAVATVVLFVSPLRLTAPNGAIQGFSPEAWPRYGILLLAMPLLVAITLPALQAAYDNSPVALSKTRSDHSRRSWGWPRSALFGAVAVAVWGFGVRALVRPGQGLHNPNHWTVYWSANGMASLALPGGWHQSVLHPSALIAASQDDNKDPVPPQIFLLKTATPASAGTAAALGTVRHEILDLSKISLVSVAQAPQASHWTIELVAKMPYEGREFVLITFLSRRRGDWYTLSFWLPAAEARHAVTMVDGVAASVQVFQ